jgi:hypothetical protein
MISDKTIEQILQARRWLHPDISLKYRRALESLLSYSHTNTGSTALIDSAPILPSLSHEYEIAYLGLPSQTGFDFSHGGSSVSDAEYRARLAEIEGANISEENKNGPEGDPTQNPATQCGPPDGVPLAQWPAAIMCWIRAQFPPRILAGACGPSTIGLASPLSVPPVAPSLSISTDSGALTAFYSGSVLIPQMDRSSMRITDTLPITVSISKNNTPLIVPAGTT